MFRFILAILCTASCILTVFFLIFYYRGLEFVIIYIAVIIPYLMLVARSTIRLAEDRSANEEGDLFRFFTRNSINLALTLCGASTDEDDDRLFSKAEMKTHLYKNF